jgi:hypothetical protein
MLIAYKVAALGLRKPSGSQIDRLKTAVCTHCLCAQTHEIIKDYAQFRGDPQQ